MSSLLVSSKGQIVLPAKLRRKLGMGAGARIEVHEEPDGLKLRVVRAVATADITGLAGMVKAPARDFADALHVARSSRASVFATFDRRLAKRAQALALVPAVELLG